MDAELEAMGLELPEVKGHPNRLPFRGVLTLVATPSRRPPGGAQGHRVMLTRRATEAALPSLLGMAVDYGAALNAHDVRQKIGVVTEANIVPLRESTVRDVPQGLKPSFRTGGYGTAKAVPFQNPAAKVAVSGFLYEHDFPNVVEELRANGGKLGMSYEIAAREIVGRKSPIWTVTSFVFTGAAVLKREKAAYPETEFVISN